MAEFLLSFDPKSLSPEDYRVKFCEFIEEYEFEQLQRLIVQQTDADAHHSFYVHCHDLIHFDCALAYTVFHYPKLLLPVFEEALDELQRELQHHHTELERKWKRKAVVKVNCHLRLISLPSVSELSKQTIADIRSKEVNSLIQITGTIVRTGGIRMLELSKQYECQNPKCRFRFTVTADPEQDHMIPQPRSCMSRADPSNVRVGGGGYRASAKNSREKNGSSNNNKCTSTNLREIEGSKVCVDYQEIKLQDQIERLTLGSVPRTIVVMLQADLVDKFNAGDDVTIVGTMVRRWRPVARGVRCTVDIALEANSIVALNASEQKAFLSESTAQGFGEFWKYYRSHNQPFAARNIIVKSICPRLFGMFNVKLSLLLTLIGGRDPNSSVGKTVITNEDTTETTANESNSNRSTNMEVNTTTVDQDRGISRRFSIHMLMVCSNEFVPS